MMGQVMHQEYEHRGELNQIGELRCLIAVHCVAQKLDEELSRVIDFGP
jgi:hypothetical protein